MRLIYGVIYDTFFNSRPALVLGRLSRMRDTSRRAEGGTPPPGPWGGAFLVLCARAHFLFHFQLTLRRFRGQIGQLHLVLFHGDHSGCLAPVGTVRLGNLVSEIRSFS